MPKPTTKAQLLSESLKERQALEKYLFGLSPAQMTQPGILGEWSVKDVLAHLYEWEQMVIGWIEAGQRGDTPAIPAPGFKWSQLPALNQQIYAKHKDRPLNEVLTMFQASYQQVMTLIESLPEEDLFTPGLYRWMNQNTLAAYLNSCTGSHYRWARKEIRKPPR